MARTKAGPSYVRSIKKFAQGQGWELVQLSQVWPAIEKAYKSRRRSLLNLVPEDDPAKLSVDLLQPISRGSDETAHTMALAYLLDPACDHGLGNAILRTIVEAIGARNARVGAARILRVVRRRETRLTVTPEYHHRVSGLRHRSGARTDIWIEAHARKKSAVVVIENKIGAAESNGQLGWYEEEVTRWCRRRGHSRFLLIFLTPEGRKPVTSKANRWIPMSYLTIAGILRYVWQKNKRATGAAWLGLYIASILRGIVGVDLHRSDSVSASQLETYLRGNR